MEFDASSTLWEVAAAGLPQAGAPEDAEESCLLSTLLLTAASQCGCGTLGCLPE
jgi:hypothetical protein